jgi:FtsH-binding integral membrane protein
LRPGRRPGAGYLAVAGGALATIGMLLFVQNVTGYWRSWAYAWALIPVGAMIGLRYARRYVDTERSRQNSAQVVRVMLWVFTGFAGLFELILFRDLRMWPLIVVAFGIWLIVRDRRNKEYKL